MEVISRFRGEYRFLSNFAESPFEFEGYTYATVEHAYQERKTLDPERRKLIREAKTAFESAKLGRAKETIVQVGWLEGKKGEVMFQLVYQKFAQNPELAQKLIETKDAILIEGNYWHDNYFGICSCPECHEKEQPKNILGEILMDVRKALNDKLYDEFIKALHRKQHKDGTWDCKCGCTRHGKSLFLREKWHCQKCGGIIVKNCKDCGRDIAQYPHHVEYCPACANKWHEGFDGVEEGANKK